jgi:hypothetical protein
MTAAEIADERSAAVHRDRAHGAWRAVVASLALTTACQSSAPDTHRPRPTPIASSASAVASAPRFVSAPSELGAVEPFIQEQIELSNAAGGRTLVYVGAPWCEPCQRFHAAVLRGELDGVLARTRLLEFDAEHHGAALHRAGYAYEFIPVIALPNPDGRSSGHLLSGSIKGPSAVTDDILPRLRALLDGRQVD